MWPLILLLVGIVLAAILVIIAVQLYHDNAPNRTLAYPPSIAALVILLVAVIIFLSTFTSKPQVTIPIPPSSTALPTCVASTHMAIDGSTALQPLVQDVANDYTTHCPSTQITVSGGDSQQGLMDVEDGTTAIGNSDVPTPQTADYSDLNDHVVAIVIYVIIIHQGLGITNLTTDQIQKIYNGTYTNWNQLGRANQPITAISRKVGSGTRATFDKYILGGVEKSTSQLASNTEEVVHNVQTIPGTIGYVSLHDALQNPTNLSIISINGYQYTNYVDNSYTYWNLEHMYTKHRPASDSISLDQQLTQAFINYMGNTDIVKQIIKNDSFISVEEVSHDVLVTHYER